MDEYDIKILNIVQRDSRRSTEKIADEVGLSPSAVQRRLKRLRETGIIESEVAIVSPEAIGRKVMAIVEVVMQRERPLSAPQNEFKRLMLASPEVMHCYHVTGDVDFIVIVSAEDMEDYEALTRKLFIDNPAVRGYRTHIVMKRVKSGTAIPMRVNRDSPDYP